MNWIDSRRLALVAALLALACVPTVLHSYVGMTVSDGRDVTQVPMSLNGLTGRATERRAASVLNAYGTTDFIERTYGTSLKLFVARSYDAKPLYHHPELAVAHGDTYDRAVVVRRNEPPAVPVFVLEGAGDWRSVYALMYGDEFIDRPMLFQMRNALTLLVQPKRLTTLFFVRAPANKTVRGVEPGPAESLLFAAIDSFRAQTRRPER